MARKMRPATVLAVFSVVYLVVHNMPQTEARRLQQEQQTAPYCPLTREYIGQYTCYCDLKAPQPHNCVEVPTGSRLRHVSECSYKLPCDRTDTVIEEPLDSLIRIDV